MSRFVEPLANPDQELTRTIRLAILLYGACSGSSLDGAVLARLSDRFERLPSAEQQDAVHSTNLPFDYMDVDRLSHLCAGMASLFGPNGTLAPGLMSGGSSELYPARHVARFPVRVPPVLFGR